MTEPSCFHNINIKQPLTFDELIKEIASYIQEKPEASYQITVGSDSPGVQNPFFVTAVTVLRVGNGGRYFWTKSERIECFSLQERIYKEAMRSITLTQELKGRLKDEFGEEFFWLDKIKVHIDVGKNGSTKDFVEGVTGMVTGYGLEAVIKPNAFCACTVADRHT